MLLRLSINQDRPQNSVRQQVRVCFESANIDAIVTFKILTSDQVLPCTQAPLSRRNSCPRPRFPATDESGDAFSRTTKCILLYRAVVRTQKASCPRRLCHRRYVRGSSRNKPLSLPLTFECGVSQSRWQSLAASYICGAPPTRAQVSG